MKSLIQQLEELKRLTGKEIDGMASKPVYNMAIDEAIALAEQAQKEWDIDLLQEKAKSVLKGKEEGWEEALEAVENISKVIGLSRHETQRVMKEKDWQDIKKSGEKA